MICIDLFTGEYLSWMGKYNPKKKTGPYGSYYTLEVSRSDKKTIVRRAKNSGIKYRMYDKRWARSSDYRSDFFKHYKPPYRCRYCNKKLDKSDVVVDHLVPINKVKSKTSARSLLYIQGIHTVSLSS